MNTAATRRIGKLLLFKKIYLFVSRDEMSAPTLRLAATNGERSLPAPVACANGGRPTAARAVSFFKSFALDFHTISRLSFLSYGC